MESKGLWNQMQGDEEPQKGDWNMDILRNMMKDMVSTAPKVSVNDCVIVPYMTNDEGGTCWCIKAGDRILAVSNRAGCEQVIAGMKKLTDNGTDK